MRLMVVVGALLTAGACSPEAMHGAFHHAAPASAMPAPQQEAASGEITVNVQGDQAAWIANPNTHAFYDLTKAQLGAAAPTLDFPTYRDKSYEIFRALGASMGWPPGSMVDHLKAIPEQMVEIVKSDPHVLDSYDTFIVALMGPQ